MTRKKLCMIGFCLLFLTTILLETAGASEQVIFGPARYERNTGKPVTETSNFTSPAGTEFTMTVINGTGQGEDRVSSAEIMLNGDLVVGPSDFNQQVGQIERTVSLNATNQLAVTLYGKPGSFITVTITGISIGPSVNISASPATVQAGNPVTLTWNTTNADTCEIDQGIGSVALNGSLQVTPSATTTYTITASGPDGTATDSVTVTVTYPAPTINISADPQTIHFGESCTLTWNSTNADTCEIDQGIGTVSVNGSVSVSPGQTTTYTITVTGPGGTATNSVIVTVTHPPTVSISAAPQTIQIGGSCTLTWISTNADTCEIDQGIGTVSANGAVSVSPSQTTTYTITATGAGGTATNSVTVTVTHPPTVNISADPQTIHSGEYSTLTWNTNNADTCEIDQGIGSVALNGSLQVTPSATTTYTITATNTEGTSTADVTVNVVSPISLTITSPAEGDTIEASSVIVTGTVANASGNETSVVVNDRPTFLNQDQFTAYLPVTDGTFPITVSATDTAGNTAETTVTANAVMPAKWVSLVPEQASGVSPLETSIEFKTAYIMQTTGSDISSTGPGLFEVLGSEPKKFSVRMTGPGVYYIHGTVTDETGATYSNTVPILVYDRAELDAMLKAKWNGMKTQLLAGDIDAALTMFIPRSRDKYGPLFRAAATTGLLSQLVSEMEDIEMIYADEYTAKYRIRRDEDIDGQVQKITYYIYFTKGSGGLWHIVDF